jgi:hypothetical protein
MRGTGTGNPHAPSTSAYPCAATAPDAAEKVAACSAGDWNEAAATEAAAAAEGVSSEGPAAAAAAAAEASSLSSGSFGVDGYEHNQAFSKDTAYG